MSKFCSCCNKGKEVTGNTDTGEYVCYCSKVTEETSNLPFEAKGQSLLTKS